MFYDYEYSRPSYHYRPRYYSTYESPWYVYPLGALSSTSTIRRPYRYNFDYLDIPDYKYRYYTTFTPRPAPVWSQADRYSFIHGLTFRENAADIRYSANKVLEDIRSPRSGSVPRNIRASSVSSVVRDSDYFNTGNRARRAVSRARMSEAPSYHNISKTIVY